MIGLVGPVPSLGEPWDVIVAAALVVGALAVLWRQVLRPVWKGLDQAGKAGPVLAKIAKDFEGNGRPTLKEVTDSLKATDRKHDAQLRRMEKTLRALEQLAKGPSIGGRE